MQTVDLRYPIGKFFSKGQINDSERSSLIQQLAETPSKLRAAVEGLTDTQLDTPYRPGGWTVRQVVHHVPDSHLNAYIRCKLALTEDNPTIKPYEQQHWAELHEAKTAPIEMSLTLLESLHQRWVAFLNNLHPADFSRTFIHPESGIHNLEWLLQMYAWHGRHHTAHITSLRQRNDW